MHIRIQVAGVSSLPEALALERLGVDALGFTVRLPHGVHDGLTEERAREIVRALPPFVAAVAITYVAEAEEAIELARDLGVGTLQLHGTFPAGGAAQVRAALPHLKILRAVCVTGPESLAEAQGLAAEADGLILDTFDSATGRRGATGRTHDWSISRAIVAAVPVPVILAGGLHAGNVAEAIRAVRPWGVDVHSGVEDAQGGRDLDRAAAFVAAVRGA